MRPGSLGWKPRWRLGTADAGSHTGLLSLGSLALRRTVVPRREPPEAAARGRLCAERPRPQDLSRLGPASSVRRAGIFPPHPRPRSSLQITAAPPHTCLATSRGSLSHSDPGRPLPNRRPRKCGAGWSRCRFAPSFHAAGYTEAETSP